MEGRSMIDDNRIMNPQPRDQVIFFVLDTSTGIEHRQIDTINQAMLEAIFF